MIITDTTIVPTSLSVLDDNCLGIQLSKKSHINCTMMIYLHYELLGGWSVGISHNPPKTQSKAHHGDWSDGKRNLVLSANDFYQTMGLIIVWDMIYISLFMKRIYHKVTVFYPFTAFGGMWCGYECHMPTQLPHFQTNIPVAQNHSLMHHRDTSKYVFTDHVSTMVNTRREHVMCFISKQQLFQ